MNFCSDERSGKKPKKSQRIKGGDFCAWDKFDAEEECKKVDDPEFVSTKKKVNLNGLLFIDLGLGTNLFVKVVDQDSAKGHFSLRIKLPPATISLITQR